MNEKNADLEPASMTDDELDTWLSNVNDDLCETLDRVVDTEDALLRLKQSVAKEAVAVAHKSGSDGADRAIRSVLNDEPPAPLTNGAAQRNALGRAGRVPQAMASSDASVRSMAWAVAALTVAAGLLIVALVPLMADGFLRGSNTSPSSFLIAVSFGSASVALLSVLTPFRVALQRRKRQQRHRQLLEVSSEMMRSCLRRHGDRTKQRKPRHVRLGQAVIRWVARLFSTPAVYFIEKEQPKGTMLLIKHSAAQNPPVEPSANEREPDVGLDRVAELITSGSGAVMHGSPERNKPARVIRPASRPAARPPQLGRRGKRRRGGRDPRDPA